MSLIGTLQQEIHFSLRQLRRTPGFALTAIVVFALSIAASTSIFAFVSRVLVEPLPYREPARLVALFERIPVGDRYHLSYGDYLDFRRQNHSFTSLDAYRSERFRYRTATDADEVPGARVSDGFFRTLGVTPILGRDFRPGEDLATAQQTVMLSYDTWQARFAGDPAVLGRAIRLDGDPAVIIGVLPRAFHFAPVGGAGFWVPLRWAADLDPRAGHPYFGVARLEGGISLAAADQDVRSIAQQIAAAHPQSNRDRSANLLPLTEVIVGDVRPTLVALLGGAGLLSLIGFVNVSSLLLVRAEGRRRETAVRAALGASRARLVRQFAVDGFLLAGAGCAVGLLLTRSMIAVLSRQVSAAMMESMPYLHGLHLSGAAVCFAAALSVTGGLLFSAGPAVQLFVSDTQTGLLEGGRSVAGRTWRRAGNGLIVAEVAITVVLLTGAGLLAKSFYRLLHEDVGIMVDHLAVLHIVDEGDTTDAQLLAMQRRVHAAVASLPGVRAAGESQELAVDSGEGYSFSFAHFRVVGRRYVGEGDEANERGIGVGYFETVRARLLDGRLLREGDDASKPSVALINQTMARQFFPGERAVGGRVVNEYDPKHPIEIVGVVEDIRDGPLDGTPTAAIYESLKQSPVDNYYVTARTAVPPDAMLPAMARAVRDTDHGLIVNGEDTMAARIDHSQAAYLHRSAAWLVAGFATLALLLGTVGLYGVTSYSVGQRTREIGVRMALGAQRGAVHRMILKEAGRIALLGVAGGLFCAVAAASLLRSLLFAVSPWDGGTLVCVGCVLAVATISASYLPARRAARVEPMEALRTE